MPRYSIHTWQKESDYLFIVGCERMREARLWKLGCSKAKHRQEEEGGRHQQQKDWAVALQVLNGNLGVQEFCTAMPDLLHSSHGLTCGFVSQH